jgi:hypothetical protein
VRAPPDNGRGRGTTQHPGLALTITTTTEAISSETVARPATVIPLADARQRRVERVEAVAGPWWGGRCLASASWAEASRTRWSA